VDVDKARDRSFLLVDDLYRSGATAAAVTEALLKGGAKTVRFLAMTKTRTRT
jgi:predicted amidophosphoribosyltransferase